MRRLFALPLLFLSPLLGAQATPFGAQGPAKDKRMVVTDSNSTPAVRRVALIVGNTHYEEGGLTNPEVDAKAMAGALRGLGFDTTLVLDADRSTMKGDVDAFAAKLHSKNAFGFFYYSGHGAQYQGKNFLIPIGYDIKKPADLETQGFNLGGLFDALGKADNGANVIVLDACRDNPFAGSKQQGVEKGLATVDAPVGTFIAYATAPGKTATDSGAYRECLVDSLKSPGLQVEQTFRRTRKEMVDKTHGAQVPWDASSLVNDYYLVPGSAPAPPANQKPDAATLASWVEKGDAFRDGRNGQSQDIGTALTWYRKAADAGNGRALARLGYMSLRGVGVPQDPTEGVRLLRKSVDAGDPDGTISLACMYMLGANGERPNPEEAGRLFVKDIEAGDPRGLTYLGTLVAQGVGGFAKDEPKAMELFRKGAEKGDGLGMVYLGLGFMNGTGVRRDPAEAVQWFRKAAEAGQVMGMTDLGLAYATGNGIRRDMAEATRWFRQAAGLGDANAMFYVGYGYETGQGLPRNMPQAISCYRDAASRGSQAAQQALQRLGVNG